MPNLWPADLPRSFTQDSYSRTPPDGLIRSDNDVGPAKVRQRSSAAVAPLAGDMVMTLDQVRSLDAFIAAAAGTGLAGGSLPFWFPDQEGGEPLLVRLSGMPPRVRNGRRFRVSFKLEILP